MFGSLVIIYPTVHDGGSLIFREGKKEWTFDSACAVAGWSGACVAFAAFYSDVDHEVTPVNSGYRITVTYNLRFTDIVLPISNPSLGMLSFQSAFEKLLRDPTFLPNGGWLGFGLRHVYPMDVAPLGKVTHGELKFLDYRLKGSVLTFLNHRLKGSDADIQAAAQTLSLEASLWMLYQEKGETVICPKVPKIPSNQQWWDFDGYDSESLAEYLQAQGGGYVIPSIKIDQQPPKRRRRRDEDETDASGKTSLLNPSQSNPIWAPWARLGRLGK